MPIEPHGAAPAALFLFAHQDDEFGVFHAIETCCRRGQWVVCAYLTRGSGDVASRRNAESIQVLGRLGVAPENVVFPGDELGIDDAAVYLSLERTEAWVEQWFSSFGTIDSIYLPAWEGGHHDHDALHVVAARVADRLGLLSRLRQFALYNGYRCPGPLFRVLAPLTANGPVESFPIPLRRRVAYLGLCLQYPSQWKTWVGLFPFVLLHYLLDGRQTLQSVRLDRTEERPHAGTLYYEKRNFCSWERMRERLQAWAAQKGDPRRH